MLVFCLVRNEGEEVVQEQGGAVDKKEEDKYKL